MPRNFQRRYRGHFFDEVLAYYEIYHDLLSTLIQRMKKERGYALLFDCHSMTSKGLGRVREKGQGRANFVIGTLQRSSAHRLIIDSFSAALEKEIKPHGLGLSIARNIPFAGGFITRKHHNPGSNVHVIQLEVSMDTYMYEATIPKFKRYALKKPRLMIVRKAVRAAFRVACQAAEKMYQLEGSESTPGHRRPEADTLKKLFHPP